jgi:hypothetical protein
VTEPGWGETSLLADVLAVLDECIGLFPPAEDEIVDDKSTYEDLSSSYGQALLEGACKLN